MMVMDLPQTRLYVELIPSDESRRELEQITRSLKPYVKGRAIDPAKWHVTILHFGVAEHVYYDLQRELPNISRTRFNEALAAYIGRAKNSLPGPTNLKTEGVELFGINENVLVLRLEANAIVTVAYEQALADLTVFLTDCGVSNVEEFMQSSINFRWALQLKPHITLYRGVVDYTPHGIKLPAELSFESADLHGL